MPDESGWRYYAAIVASGVSVLGWLGVIVAGLYAASLSVMGESPVNAATWLLVAGAVGIAFAVIEKRLYRTDGTG